MPLIDRVNEELKWTVPKPLCPKCGEPMTVESIVPEQSCPNYGNGPLTPGGDSCIHIVDEDPERMTVVFVCYRNHFGPMG